MSHSENCAVQLHSANPCTCGESDRKRDPALFDCKPGGIIVMPPMETLRDRFAIAVIGDIYSTFIRESGNACGDPEWREGIASDAYQLADAMVKARAK